MGIPPCLKLALFGYILQKARTYQRWARVSKDSAFGGVEICSARRKRSSSDHCSCRQHYSDDDGCGL